MIAPEQFRDYFPSFALAIGVHVLVALAMILGTLNWKPFRQQPTPVGLTIEAVMVDTSQILQQRQEALEAQEAAEQRKLREERRERELEAQKIREQQAEEQRKIDQEKRRQEALEQQRQKEAAEEARRKREAQEKLQQLRLDREKKLQEERRKQEQELERVRQQAAEAEKQRKAEAERLKEMEARQQREAEQKRQQAAAVEQQKQEQLADQRAAQAGRIATLEDEYKAAVQRVVTQNWLRPPTAQPGLRCTLRIAQIPGGEVISAAIAGSCNADDPTRRSIIAAVERVDALPYRGYEEVFEREIEFIFIYDGD